MKKILVTALMLALILSLAACGSGQPEVTIVPTEAPAATAEPTVEPTVEPTAEPTPLPENPETEEQILNNFLEDFTRAYFYGTAEDVQPFLAADFQGPVDAYQGGEPSAIETRLLFPQENDPSRYVASIQFVAGDEDSYTYLAIDLVNTEDGWKVAFYGLEK